MCAIFSPCLAVDVETKKILAMEVTTDDAYDSEALPALINDASKLRRISRALMDGAFDSAKTYRLLRRMGVKAVIKPRHNARADRGPPERRRVVKLIRTLGEEEWGRIVGYGRRWVVETAFSTFKRQYGEYCMAKNMEREPAAKAYIYNMLINL